MALLMRARNGQRRLLHEGDDHFIVFTVREINKTNNLITCLSDPGPPEALGLPPAK